MKKPGTADHRPLVFRTARDGDLDRLIEIHTSAFPDPRGHAERRRNFVANPLGPLDALWVAVEGGEPVAHAFLFHLRQWFAGSAVPVGAIASVGVAPGARGRGIAAKLLGHLHAQAEARRACLTVLYGFRQGFYAAHGYAAVTPFRVLNLHPAAIPKRWRDQAQVELRGARPGDRDEIVGVYARAARSAHGWLERPEALWDRSFADERRVWIVASSADGVVGYVVWSLLQAEPHAATRLVVHELVAEDAAVRRALFGAVGAQRDQVSDVSIEVDAVDPIDRALLDADRARSGRSALEHVLGEVAAGPMVRLVDASRALTSRRYASDGFIDLCVDARPALRLTVARGRARLAVVERATAPLRLERATLGALLFGGLSAAGAARLGLVEGTPPTLARADALLASPPFFALDSW